jgi:hypothetical protein
MRAKITIDMTRRSGFLPDNDEFVRLYLMREVRWLSAAVYRLALHGLALRLLTVSIFVVRNYTRAELWQRLTACLPRRPARVEKPKSRKPSFVGSAKNLLGAATSGPSDFMRRHMTRSMPRASRMPAPSGTARARAEAERERAQKADGASLDA